MEQVKRFLTGLKRKDEKLIRNAGQRLRSKRSQDIQFSNRASAINIAINGHAFYICDVLRKFLDYSTVEKLIGRPFSEAVVISVLQDREFIAFLIEANLINRTIKLDYNTSAEFKIRLYIAILNFDEYKKGISSY